MIRCEGLCKTYQVWRRPWDRLVQWLHPSSGRVQLVPALRDLELTIKRGESVGIIGDNGAGKTTLLRCLAGITQPTAGTVRMDGRVGALIEIGAGFHDDFSGRENVYMNGAILGFSRSEVAGVMPSIEEFSELGEWMDRPVRAYSLGMRMRLGFSIAVSIQPDVLLIDEVLAVGDNYFQKKCIDRILEEFRQPERSVVLCSHNLNQVRLACERAVWLHEGRVRADGEVFEITDQYENVIRERRGEARSRVPLRPMPHDVAARIRRVELLGEDGQPRELVRTFEPFIVRVEFEVDEDLGDVHVGLLLERSDRETVFGAGTLFGGLCPRLRDGVGSVHLEFLPSRLLAGEYAINAYLTDSSALHIYHKQEPALRFRVPFEEKHLGLFVPEHRWVDENEPDSSPSVPEAASGE